MPFAASAAVGISMMYPPRERKKIAGLTFATVGGKLDTLDANAPHLKGETHAERLLNLTFAGISLATVIDLWIYFR